jgi:hypothetical protein
MPACARVERIGPAGSSRSAARPCGAPPKETVLYGVVFASAVSPRLACASRWFPQAYPGSAPGSHPGCPARVSSHAPARPTAERALTAHSSSSSRASKPSRGSCSRGLIAMRQDLFSSRRSTPRLRAFRVRRSSTCRRAARARGSGGIVTVKAPKSGVVPTPRDSNPRRYRRMEA